MSSPIEQLRAALAMLPESAAVLAEDEMGWKFDLVRARAIGTATDDPGLVLKLVRIHS